MRLKHLFILFLLFALIPLQAGGRLSVIVDTDGHPDDMLAILYLLKKRNVEVLAITTTGSGMGSWQSTAPNMLNLLKLAKHPKIPVSFGAKKSLSPYGQFPKRMRAQIDEVYGIELPKNTYAPSSKPSWQLMSELILNSDEKVTILCLAPMTNLAMALEKDPSIAENIERVVISGGAIRVPGNIRGKNRGTHNRSAEYNLFLDAKAADVVFSSDLPITLVPLDVAEEAPITHEMQTAFENTKNNPLAHFVSEASSPIASSKKTSPYLWDPMVAALMTDPKLGHFDEIKLRIYQKPGPKYGSLIESEEGIPVSVCTSMNVSKFYSLFQKTIHKKW